jgi:SRSO17 transposase
LEGFAGEVFESLARRDQRDKGAAYLRGLLLDGRRKSMQPMAERLGVDRQGLQQFVSSSTWDVASVRARLAAKAVAVVAPQAWVVDDTGFPKDGTASPGVARQYSGTLGKVGNCQIAVSVHAATDAASAPLDWRLFLPARWDPACVEAGGDEQARAVVAHRRARAGIPEEVGHRPKWQLALDMIDELATWGQRPPVVCADAGYGNNGDFRHGLATRGISYIVQVEDDLTAFDADTVPEVKPYPGVGPHPKPRYRTTPTSLREHIQCAGRENAALVSWREGSRGTLASTFLAVRVRPAGRKHTHRLGPDGTLAPAWLLADWPAGEPTPVKYWLSNLPKTTPITELVRLGKIRWRIEHNYRELKEGLGLDHFEGRTWTGWHRHVTLVTAAHWGHLPLAGDFATTLRADPKAQGAA